MSKFNKLYNNILNNIISQNKQYRLQLLEKSTWNDLAKKKIIKYLDGLNNNKLADLLCKFISNKSLTMFRSEQERKVKNILQLNPSIDTQNFQGTIQQFLNKYYTSEIEQKYQNRLNKQTLKKEQELDKIPEFSEKKKYEKQVTVYKVEDSKEGMMAVRKIVDVHWGKDADPWCLIARDKNGDMDDAWDKWCLYSAYPKHIAFQEGYLIGFCADSGGNCTWWDRNDRPSSKQLKLIDGSFIQTEKYHWTDEEKVEKFLKRNPELVYNKITKRYDSEYDIQVWDQDLIDGHYPVQFGIIDGDFDSEDIHSENLISLKGAPTYVGGTFRCTGNFESLEGCPEKVGKNFILSHCLNLKSLAGGPTEIGGSFRLNYISKLKSLEGGPIKVGHCFSINQCYSLQSLKGCPKIINGQFSIYKCDALKSLEGGPQFIKDSYSIEHCPNLFDLVGAPQYVGYDFIVIDCQNLEDKQGEPERVIGNKLYKQCKKLYYN